MQYADITVIGAGIVGAATAWQLCQQLPGRRIRLIEKEPEPARHQTGRNSGVIHAGVYYAPGSLKARFCREGLDDTIAFCRQHGLPYLQCGKLIVATNDLEETRLQALFERCSKNGLSPEPLDQQALRQREPDVKGQAAFFVRQTGITDYKAITDRLLGMFTEAGGELVFNCQVQGLHQSDSGVHIETPAGNFSTGLLINCAGLHADRLIRAMQLPCDFQILPFRGEYYRVSAEAGVNLNHLIYPVPDPELPFLGVHLTRMIDGSVTVGPNAVLALAREGYHKSRFNLRDVTDMLTFPGTWSLFRKELTNGVKELKNSLYKPGYLALVRRYCDKIDLHHLQPYPSGVRAQAVTQAGELLHDFRFVESEYSLHVGNAPSPAATSAMPIARHIASLAMQKLPG